VKSFSSSFVFSLMRLGINHRFHCSLINGMNCSWSWNNQNILIRWSTLLLMKNLHPDDAQKPTSASADLHYGI